MMLEWGTRAAGLTEIVLDGRTVGHADPGTFRERAEVDIGGQGWLFSKQRGELLGQRDDESTPRFRARAGLLSNRPTLDVAAATPVEHQVFLLWIAFVMRRRAASSGS